MTKSPQRERKTNMSYHHVLFTTEHDAPVVAKQQVVRADSWLVFETEIGHVHLSLYLGHLVARLTSAVQQIDLHTRTLTTSSGQRYLLTDAPEFEEMKVALIRANAVRTLGHVTDVSHELWTQVQAAAH